MTIDMIFFSFVCEGITTAIHSIVFLERVL
jgi:hypothetical protein